MAAKRKDLTLNDKMRVLEALDQKKKQSDIAKSLGISQTQVSWIGGKREELTKKWKENANPDRKRDRAGKSQEVDVALYRWFNQAQEKGLPVNGPLLREKAEKLAKTMNMPNFEATNGWLQRWKERNNLSYKKLHGEQASADVEAGSQWIMNVLPTLLDGCSSVDLYNCDETGLYYRALPDGTYAKKSEKVHGGKKSKERITVLLCCNFEGSHKLPPLVIGKSKKPRCFSNVKEVPLPYQSNGSSWMTSEIFVEWLLELDKDMRKQKRNILLFADKAPCHGVSMLPKLSNVTLHFLPANTTSQIQPLDQGIIRAMKAHYRKRLLSTNLVARIDDNTETSLSEYVKSISLLDAIHMLKYAWAQVSCVTIQNCFRKAGFAQLTESIDSNATSSTPPCNSDSHVLSITGLSDVEFEQYVNMDNEIDCYGDLSDEQLVEDLQQCSSSHSDEEEEEQACYPQTKPTEREAMEALGVLRAYLDAYGLSSAAEDYFGGLETCIIDKIAEKKQHQTSLLDFFSCVGQQLH